jgi:signal transduction histidine kinase
VGATEQGRERRSGHRRGTRSSTVRRRIGAAILLVAVLAVALFAVPLALAASRLFREEAATRLAREASRAAGAVSDEALGGRAPIELPPPLDARTMLAAYDESGARLAGDGPEHADLPVAVARDGQEHEQLVDGRLAVAVPIRVGRRDGAVLAAAPYDEVVARTRTAWAAMTVLALAVLAVAAVLAQRQAARIATPLEELTGAARALGTGNFTVRARPSGLREADEASRALEVTAQRLGGLLERERAFSADASHQIRTPLTALRLGLESALLDPASHHRTVLTTALERIDRVEATVDELLSRARDTLTPAGPVDLGAVLEQGRAGRWADLAGHAGRPLAVETEPGLPLARASGAVVHQVLDVLVSNALEHGAGPVRVTARRAGAGLAVEVSDTGPGFDTDALRSAFIRRHPEARGHGIGLALAQDLAEADGGRLIIRQPGPGPVVALILPSWTGTPPKDSRTAPGSAAPRPSDERQEPRSAR